MISSCTGIEPPTSPVFPLYGTTASYFRLQYFKINETYSVVVGVSTTEHLP